MEPKAELLVFNKKEITVILVLLVLVSLFSFTLGLRLGKSLGVTKADHIEQAPLAEKSEGTKAAVAVGEHGEGEHGATEHGAAEHDATEHGVTGHGATEHGAAKASHSAHGEEGDLPKTADSAKAAASEEQGSNAAKKAEGRADSEFAKEASKEKLVSGKMIPMSLPTDKKGEGEGPRFTLQVGSHRTVAEATEQVTLLKSTGFNDAFYVAASVPGHGTRYRVGVGVFANKEAAERSAAKWKATKHALPFYIVQRINE